MASRRGVFIPVPIVLLLGLIFVGFGDKFLPSPLSEYSTQSRTALNQVVLGLFPSWQPSTNPYDRTEKEIEKQQ